MSIEEKQRQLQELKRLRRQKQEEQQRGLTEPSHNQYASLSSEPTNIDNLVEQLVAQKENQKLYQETTP